MLAIDTSSARAALALVEGERVLGEILRPGGRDFDVGLHVIFKDRAAHDHYQETEAHLKFIEENKAGWAKVRVFDTVAGQTPTH